MNTKEKNMYRLYKARTAHLKWVKVFESEELIKTNIFVDEISDNYYHGPRSH